MKIYQKKNSSLEDETVLVQLERRHTLKEDTNEADSDDNHRKKVRANSLDSLGEGSSSTDIEAVTAEKQSKLKRRPTVITESELSSSTLYKDRKAKINSDDESIEDPRPTIPPADHEDLEPRILNDPKLIPTPVSNQRPRKKSSCCWYFTIILVIFIACLAVMAGVAGIVYMEYFAIYEDKDTANTNVSAKKDAASASKEIFQHPAHKDDFHPNEPHIPEHILKDIIKNSTTHVEDPDASRKAIAARKLPREVIFHNKDRMDSSNSKGREQKNKSFVSENQDIEVSDVPIIAGVSNVLRNILSRIHILNVPISDKSVKIKSNEKNQDSLDSYSQSIDGIMDKTTDDPIDKINEQMTVKGSIVSEKSNSKAEVLDSNEEKIPDKSVEVKPNDKNHDSLDLNPNFQNINDIMDKKIDGHVDKVNEQMAVKGSIVSEKSNSKAEILDSNEEMKNIPDKSVEVKPNDKNQDSLDLNPNFPNFLMNDIMDKTTDGNVDKVNAQRTGKSNSKAEVLNSNEETLVSGRNFNLDEMTTLQGIDSKGERMNANVMFLNLPEIHILPDSDSLDLMENSISDDHEDNSFDHKINDIDHDLKDNFFDHGKHPITHDSEDDSFDHRKHATDQDLENNSFDQRKNTIAHDPEDNSFDHRKTATDHEPEDKFLKSIGDSFVPNDKSLSDHNEDSSDSDSDDSSPEKHSLVNDQNQNSDDSAQLVFIRPVVESKAVPIPLAFLRRIGFDIKNPDSHEPITAEDMDMKFSLAGALKYLRSLDTENKLPVSREKTVTRKTSNREERKTTKLSKNSEKEEYLNLLRKQMFEKSL